MKKHWPLGKINETAVRNSFKARGIKLKKIRVKRYNPRSDEYLEEFYQKSKTRIDVALSEKRRIVFTDASLFNL